jgi:hypothetical protein
LGKEKARPLAGFQLNGGEIRHDGLACVRARAHGIGLAFMGLGGRDAHGGGAGRTATRSRQGRRDCRLANEATRVPIWWPSDGSDSCARVCLAARQSSRLNTAARRERRSRRQETARWRWSTGIDILARVQVCVLAMSPSPKR